MICIIIWVIVIFERRVRHFNKTHRFLSNVNQTFKRFRWFICLWWWIRKLKFWQKKCHHSVRHHQSCMHQFYFDVFTLTAVGRLPKKFKSTFSPNRYASGCGVSNRSPPIIKCVPKYEP